MELADMRRNPYLVDYSRERGGIGSGRTVNAQYSQRMRQASGEPRRTERIPNQRPSSGSRKRESYTVVNGGAGSRSVDQRNTYVREEARARQHRYARQQARRRRLQMQRCIVILGSLICMILLLAILRLQGGTQAAEPPKNGAATPIGAAEPKTDKQIQGLAADVYNGHPDWTEDFLTPNEYSRPGDPLSNVNSIFVHYTANPGTSAAQNRSYFESLKDTQERSASAHFIIGYNGEIIQCIPLDEIAYAVQTRNEDSISIECCFLAENGAFTQETYNSLVSLLSWLTDAYDLNVDDILRHYDCGGKKCPLYYTEHPDAWEQLKQDVKGL